MGSWCKSCLTALLAATFLAALGSTASAQTTLQYRFKKGEKLNFDVKQEMLMKMPVPGNPGQEVKMTMDMNMVLTWTIESVDDAGKAKIKVKQGFKGMSMVVDDGMGNETKMDLKDILQQGGVDEKTVMDAMEAEYSATINAQGEISDVKVPEALEKLGKDALGPLANLQGMMGGSASQALNPAGLVFPKTPLAKGGNWKGTPLDMAIPGLMKITQTKEFTLEAPVKQGSTKLEKIRAKDEMKFGIDAKAFADKINIEDVKFQGSGKSEGYLLFDNVAGRLHETHMTGGYEFNIEIPDMPAMKMNMSQKLTIKTTAGK
jgi:hypothetical protein